MKQLFNKILSSILILSIVLLNLSSVVSAQEVNTDTSIQTENTIPEPTQSIAPEDNGDTLPDPTPTSEPAPTAIPTPTKIPEAGDPNRTYSATSAYSVGVNPTPTTAPVITPVSSNNIGDTSVDTGDATNNANITTNANENLSSGPSATVGVNSTGAVLKNQDNGANSANSNSATINNEDNNNQTNSANVNTGLDQSSTTGSNSASYNVGGHTNINTGDANTTGTVITTVNTNVEGIMISEFNVVDDHVGDILLDFSKNCISGCVNNPLTAINSGNGSNSTNTGNLNEDNESNTIQTNDAFIGSNLDLSADSGNNTSSYNVGGDSNITTGDANVNANVLTFANNNIAGDVVYAVVNIFGDLIGDILFPEEFMANCCGASSNSANSGNGSGSINSANTDIENVENTFQSNDANIVNELIFDTTTGNNETSKNTGGNSTINTGNTSVDANVLNIANSNIVDGNMWLVLVNEAGNWIGKILGAENDANFAGSNGTEFIVDENGMITASNVGNGSGSDNTSDVLLSNVDNTTQSNNADIHNTLNLSANTGGNQASNNTGGDSNIKTGDAKIVANLVNFVNNNIKGNGKLFVTVVNVFGSWFGDFVSPGKTKEVDNTDHATGSPSLSNNSSTQTVNTQSSTASNATAGDNDNSVSKAIFAKASFTAFAKPKISGKEQKTTKALVKGATSDKVNTLGASDSDGKIKINLAWLVILIPFILFGISFKKYILPKLYRKI